MAMAQAKLIPDLMHREKPPQETAIPVEPTRNEPHQCDTIILSF
jgi:hypothetical protein